MRLRDPQKGTVIHCEGDLATSFITRGWVDADKPIEAEPSAPKRRGRPPKTS